MASDLTDRNATTPDGVTPGSPHEPARGRLLLMAAAVLWSTNGLFVKSPPLRALSLDERGPLIACYRALIAGACLIPLVQWRRVRFRRGLIPMLICFATMNATFVTAMTMTSTAATIFLQYTATGWVFVFGALFLKESITRENVVALLFAVAGIGWIVAGSWNSNELFGVMLALVSGMAYAGVIVSLRALRDEDSAWLIVLNHLVSGLILIPWVTGRGLFPTAPQWGVIVAMGIFQMGLPYLLFSRGMAHVRSQEASLITLFEAILSPFWVWLFWNEQVPTATLIGGGFILTGLLVRFARFR